MKNRISVVLGLAAVVGLSLAAFLVFHGSPRSLWAALALAVGITVTYTYPVAGVTEPTAKQAARKNMLTATILMADADTLAVVTHNWGLSAAELTDRFPMATWNYVTPGTAPALVSWSRATNTVTFTKNNDTGAGGTFEINLERPHSLIR